MRVWVPGMIWVCLAAPLIACSPPPPSSQALQRRCDSDASAWFQAQHPDGVTRETVDSAIHTEQYTFSDHYNPRLRRCFVVTSEEISTVYPDRPASGTSGKTLMDLDTRVQLGRLVHPWPSAAGVAQRCDIASTRCNSTQEWEELAAPYLER